MGKNEPFPKANLFERERKSRNKARLAHKRATDKELRERHKILNNDYRHLFQGKPWFGGD